MVIFREIGGEKIREDFLFYIKEFGYDFIYEEKLL